MSQVGNNIYPNTTFPDSIQILPTFENLSSADESNYIDYLRAILNGNLSEANYYLSLINPYTIGPGKVPNNVVIIIFKKEQNSLCSIGIDDTI